MPVPFRTHVAFAAGTFAAHNALLLRPLVDTLVCTPEAAGATRAVYGALDSAAFTLSSLLLPHQPGRRPAAAVGARDQALIVALWLQLQLAVLLPCCCLYAHELRSRERYLQLLQQQQRQQHASSGSSGSSMQEPRQAAGGGSRSRSRSSAHAGAGSDGVTRRSGSSVFAGGSSAAPRQPMLLPVCVLALASALLLWHLLHLQAGAVLAWLDAGGRVSSAVARLAVQHGCAAQCV
jgi:hypothetical protein